MTWEVMSAADGFVYRGLTMRTSGMTCCAACGRHAMLNETHCPHCGVAMARDEQGRMARTGAAVVLGLGLAVGGAACSDDVDVYGAPPTSVGPSGSTTSGAGGDTGAGGDAAGGDAGTGGDEGGAGGS